METNTKEWTSMVHSICTAINHPIPNNTIENISLNKRTIGIGKKLIQEITYELEKLHLISEQDKEAVLKEIVEVKDLIGAE